MPSPDGILLNDVHSSLNATRVAEVLRPQSVEEVQRLVRRAKAEGRAISLSGGRHAMGGQQFATDAMHLDMTGLARVTHLDTDRGLVEVEAGCFWPALMAALSALQLGVPQPWTIRQKQTGADDLSIGGSLAANVHGRGLTLAPLVGDIEAFELVRADGERIRCDRQTNAELFRLAIGGYGLFGVVVSVTLRLMRRVALERVVKELRTADVAEAFERRLEEGYLYGDFQFRTDERDPRYLREGVFACYRPAVLHPPAGAPHRELSNAQWVRLYELAHTDKKRAFDDYSAFYLATHGQLYGSDEVQFSYYPADYHQTIQGPQGGAASEMITEIYVPRSLLNRFMEETREDFLAHHVNFFYGTVRLIEPDRETALAWARERWACIVFNLHTQHDPASLETTAGHFRRLIDRAIALGGSYYLTYHRWATREQVLACHPQLPDVLRAKRRHDPEERFQSDWYRHHVGLLHAELQKEKP